MADRRGALLIGSHISRYVVLEALGEGGMGSVYLVEHIDLKTRHAIKVLRPHLSKHPQIVQRFRNEARAAAATRSPNIVAVRDFGQLDDGSWYLVMDYWDGMTLSAFLASRGPLPHDLIVRTALDALNGLAAAHQRRIIHRDLKPDNLYLAEVDGDVRAMILDFGVCRLGEEAGVVTRTGAVIGTPRYMAPEQLRGQSIDHRADLWSIGAIVYEMGTGGWLPYDDEHAPRGQILDEVTLSARMAFPPIDPQRRAPAIPRLLADAILTMIDPDPARRPASAAACAILLAETLPADRSAPSGLELLELRAPQLLRRHAERPRNIAPSVRVQQRTTLGSAASQSHPPPPAPASPRRWRVGLLAVAAAPVAFVVAYLAIHGGPTAPRDSAKIVTSEPSDSVRTHDSQPAPPTPPAVDISVSPAVPAVTPGRASVDATATPPTRVAQPAPSAVDASASPPVHATQPARSAVDTNARSPMRVAQPAPPAVDPGVTLPAQVARPAAPIDAGIAPQVHVTRPVSAPTDTGATRAAANPAPAPVDAGAPRPAELRVPASAEAGVTPPRSAARAAAETGALAIYVVPFAQVWVDDSTVSAGQTPLHLKLRVGTHRIRLANKRLGKEKIVPVTISTAKEAVIDESW